MLGLPAEFGYAIASGGDISLNASGTVYGSIRSNGDLGLQGRLQVLPLNGQGRVLSGGTLTVASGLVVDSTQDVRARRDIVGISKISGTSRIYPSDTGPDTDPMIMDGRTTPEGAAGVVMPCPDEGKLLAGAVDHGPGPVIFGGSQTFNLDGRVHYFPGGVTFGPGSKIVGEGTLVVGQGHAAIFDIRLDDLKMNVIALDGQQGQAGTARIEFNQDTRLKGLVYCQGTILSRAHLEVEGRLIAYGDGQIVHTGAHAEVVLAPMAVECGGFSGFFDPGAGGGLDVLSWQRK
jgi:hypothetical protein